MKKLIGIFCLTTLLYGCADLPDLADVDTLTPKEEFTEAGLPTGEITDDMRIAVDTIVTETLTFVNYYKTMDWSESRDKEAQLKYVEETLEKVKNVRIPQQTESDREIYEVMFKYQYNVKRSLEYLRDYLNTGDFKYVKLLDRKLEQLQENNIELITLADKYGF